MLGLSMALNVASTAAAIVVQVARALKFNLNTNSQYIPVIGA